MVSDQGLRRGRGGRAQKREGVDVCCVPVGVPAAVANERSVCRKITLTARRNLLIDPLLERSLAPELHPHPPPSHEKHVRHGLVYRLVVNEPTRVAI